MHERVTALASVLVAPMLVYEKNFAATNAATEPEQAAE
jgi:hypothetical protein